MKKRFNIMLDPDTHKKGVKIAKEESKKQNKYISFSSLVESLIINAIGKDD